MKPSLAKIGLTPREQINASLRLAAQAFGVDPADILTRTRKPVLDMARLDLYHQLAALGWRPARIARLTGRTTESVMRCLARPRPTPIMTARATDDDLAELHMLRVAVQQWTGHEIAYRLAERFEIKLGAATILAVIVAAYPRALNYDLLLERYEAAREAMGMPSEIDIPSDLIKGAVSKARRAFAAECLPNPIVTIQPRGVRLSDDIAPWLEARFGVPALALRSYAGGQSRQRAG